MTPTKLQELEHEIAKVLTKTKRKRADWQHLYDCIDVLATHNFPNTTQKVEDFCQHNVTVKVMHCLCCKKQFPLD